MRIQKIYFLIFLLFSGLLVSAQSWTPLGPNDKNQPSYYKADYTAMAIAPDGTPYVAFIDAGNSNKVTVEKYVGGSWTIVGTAAFTPVSVVYTSIAIAPDGTPYIVYQKDNGDTYSLSSYVMKFNGSTWSQVGISNVGHQINFNTSFDTY
ncbi:MAG: hypothetical protein JSU05_14035, partial [Bacteroidetes bacterium]|nr:hypothetical protein [Bacteroidota bacterium]